MSSIKHITSYKNIFIVGLHRSGTTLLADLLKSHPNISGFSNTGFPMDEGQFLQTVFPIAKVYGGPGKFGFDKRSHLTEKSSLLNDANKKKLQKEWSIHWDLSKEYLLEKSPPNLLKTRFLQAVFPNSYFIYITRHPIAVSYATQKMSTAPLLTIFEHWIHCNKIFMQDSKYLHHVHHIKYEDLVTAPKETLSGIYDFLNIDQIDNTTEQQIKHNINQNYFKQWEKDYQKFNWLQQLKLQIANHKLKQFQYTLKVN